jgi:Heavy metal associated domain 2
VSGHDGGPESPPNPPKNAAARLDGGREVLALIHHHPGRLRVRAEAFREGDAADRVRSALDAEPGITAVAHNPRTGSLLVEYQPGHAEPETILARIASAAGLAMPDEQACLKPREPVIVCIDAARELNDLVHEITGQKADLRALLPAGMAALAVYSFVNSGEERLPRWDNLLYWSYNIFSQLHRREIEASGALRARGRDFGGASPHTRETDPEKP